MLKLNFYICCSIMSFTIISESTRANVKIVQNQAISSRKEGAFVNILLYFWMLCPWNFIFNFA